MFDRWKSTRSPKHTGVAAAGAPWGAERGGAGAVGPVAPGGLGRGRGPLVRGSLREAQREGEIKMKGRVREQGYQGRSVLPSVLVRVSCP